MVIFFSPFNLKIQTKIGQRKQIHIIKKTILHIVQMDKQIIINKKA